MKPLAIAQQKPMNHSHGGKIRKLNTERVGIFTDTKYATANASMNYKQK
jgi:hypothetical protein